MRNSIEGTGTMYRRKEMKEKMMKPYNKREEMNKKKAFARTEKTVKPVAKDTNKTRRKMMKPTK